LGIDVTIDELEQRTALPVLPGERPDAARHRLVVDGLVARPLVLTAADLAAMPQAEVTDDFVCREGWCVPGLHWEGVALTTVLEAAGCEPGAGWIQVSAGTFSAPLTRWQAERALLALRLGGEPLAADHGAPVRLILPDADCYTSIKWLDHIEARAEAGPNTARRAALKRIWG
jgi:DMSO/TMAO reductase YedYZ molybdopterin-dependent catalytic subunit